jgi:NitT/TauT family transport system substrate-binding protein
MIFGETGLAGDERRETRVRDLTSALKAAFLTGALIAAPAALVPTAAGAQTDIRLALDGGFKGTTAPFLVAQDRGYYKAESLDVTIDAAPATPDAIGRVVSGNFDVGLVDINALIRYRDRNPNTPIKALFVFYNKPAYAIIARKSRGIAQPKDLEGKKLGAPASDPATTQWPLLARLNDVDISKVAIENVALPVRDPMLAAGQVDAVTGISFSAYIDIKDRGVPVNDLVVLSMADFGLKLYGDAIIVNPKFLEENPKAVTGFLRALVHGMKDTIRDPARGIDSVLKRNDAARKDLELERLHMAIRDNIVTAEVREHGLGAVDPARMDSAIEQMASVYKFRNKPPHTADIFDPAFLPPAAERKVNEPARPG